jgi:hypothetical protein
MNAISGASALTPQARNWDSVFAEVNAWRGACLHHFSTVEMAATETLLALSIVEPTGSSVCLRHLIGQRFEDLTAAIAPGGPFAEAGVAAFPELSLYRARYEKFRALLCHGAVKVTVDHSGVWVLIIRTLSFRGRQADRMDLTLDQAEAQAKLIALKRDGQKLASLLGQLRKAVTPAQPRI